MLYNKKKNTISVTRIVFYLIIIETNLNTNAADFSLFRSF